MIIFISCYLSFKKINHLLSLILFLRLWFLTISRSYLAEILPIRCKTLYNQSINQSINQSTIILVICCSRRWINTFRIELFSESFIIFLPSLIDVNPHLLIYLTLHCSLDFNYVGSANYSCQSSTPIISK